MSRRFVRRDFLRSLGLSAAALPFVMNLPSLAAVGERRRKQRLVIVFSPNGVVPATFWPDEEGEQFTLKESLTPLQAFRDRTLILHGICDKVRGDGDQHMRGIGCLLTGIELFPGNVLGGCSEHPAGWSRGISIDQELRNFLQSQPETRTRFGSLEFGVLVQDRADTWTRMVYAGPNKPVTPVNDPYQMFAKLYGRAKHRENLASVLDGLQEDFNRLRSLISSEDARLLDEHAAIVRQMEQDLRSEPVGDVADTPPHWEAGMKQTNDNMPALSRMQIDLIVRGFAADFMRVASLQYAYSASDTVMSWLNIEGRHHDISHKPDEDQKAQQQLTHINHWFCEQVAYLASRLAETPEPGGEGSLLDNTTIVWTNELGKGNDHSHENIPFVLVGGGLGFRVGRSLKFPSVPHNRLLLSLAHAFGHEIPQFGNPGYCSDGPLSGVTT
ncbi:MAG TPA: DUF1552 domain-containing protein [Pirellulales bacterium]|nr:DUF1552 domain-containing protein [Pirellulales bacterium]